MTGRLRSKTAVVTGGSRGIGLGIATAMAADGARVLACGRATNGPNVPGVEWLTLDLAARGAGDELAAAAQARLGHVDVLVNNAGVQVEKTVAESTDADWDEVMNVNARAVFETCRAFIRVMAAEPAAGSGQGKGGVIINIGSISATVADPGMALYNASKAFVAGLTRSIAVDHGVHGIRCNAICPGWIDTGMADAAFELAKSPDRARDDALNRHAAGRLGLPADIAAAAVWLASDEAAFVTGQTITVDGGLTAASPLRPALF